MIRAQADIDPDDSGIQVAIALCYQRGEGISLNLDEAAVWFGMAASQGIARAQNSLGCMLLAEEYGGDKRTAEEHAQGLEWYQKAAAQGEKFALFNLGMEYYEGKRIAKDVKRALSMWQSSAGKGHGDASHWLGLVVRSGKEGIPINIKQALAHFKMAASLGHPEAMIQLAQMFDSGQLGKPDPKLAFQWYNRAYAHDNNLSLAMFNIARSYETGDGVKADQVLAKSWYKKAAAAGDSDAMHNLAVKYAAEVQPEHSPEAEQWYRKAAKHDHPGSHYNLGCIYQRICPIQSHVWFEKAAKLGYPPAIQTLERLEQEYSDHLVRLRNTIAAGTGCGQSVAALRPWAKRHKARCCSQFYKGASSLIRADQCPSVAVSCWQCTCTRRGPSHSRQRCSPHSTSERVLSTLRQTHLSRVGVGVETSTWNRELGFWRYFRNSGRETSSSPKDLSMRPMVNCSASPSGDGYREAHALPIASWELRLTNSIGRQLWQHLPKNIIAAKTQGLFR
jgi:TPR repeat protein